MGKEEYISCMKPYMAGGGPERKKRFCIGAKICSGKANNEQEAIKLCAEAAMNPGPPKAKKGRKFCTLRDLDAISVCLTANINLSSLTVENMPGIFSAALKKCSGVSVKRITSAQEALGALDPQQIKAIETIALLSKEAEGRQW